MIHTMLACRSEFSMGESILSPDGLVEAAKALGQSVVGLADTMSMTAMIAFSEAAKKASIKPLVGCRLRLTDNATWRPEKGQKKGDMPRSYMLTAYARTEEGLQALYRLASRGAAADRFYYEPKLAFDDLADVLCPLGHGHLHLVLGEENSLLEHPNIDVIAEELVAMNGALYAPLLALPDPYSGRLNEISMRLVASGRAQPLTLRPALYPEGQADARDVMGGIVSATRIADPWFLSRHQRDLHPMDQDAFVSQVVAAQKHLRKRGHDGPTAAGFFVQGMNNHQSFADGVTYAWSKHKPSLPAMAPDQYAAVVKACMEGWKRRFAAPVFDHLPSAKDLSDVYMPRLKYELEVLKKLDFSGYFLLVADIVSFAKSNGILVGPGRGSVGGSLVAYLMGITDCDPIRFNLLFERFINPERLDLPDADLDFMSERRSEVIAYLITKYGEARVAGVSNFGTLGAPSVIRDVGRCVGLPESVFNVSRFVPKVHNQPVDLDTAIEKAPEVAAFFADFPDLLPLSKALEGRLRNLSQHAAGVVVAGVDLEERAVVERRSEGAVVCWDKQIVENQGLIKVDVLGLRTLDQIALTLQYIRERHRLNIDLMRLPLDDAKVLDSFAKAKTTGIFQFEGGGMRNLLRKIAGRAGTVTFEDITAATALYRPGPMESGMMDSFHQRKAGYEPIEYDHPLVEPIMNTTFGVIVYQEQVMQTAQILAGYSGADADKLRKIMGKKLPEEMKKERGKFVSGIVAEVYEVELDGGAKVSVRSDKRYKTEEGGFETIADIEARGLSLLLPLEEQK